MEFSIECGSVIIRRVYSTPRGVTQHCSWLLFDSGSSNSQKQSVSNLLICSAPPIGSVLLKGHPGRTVRMYLQKYEKLLNVQNDLPIFDRKLVKWSDLLAEIVNFILITKKNSKNFWRYDKNVVILQKLIFIIMRLISLYANPGSISWNAFLEMGERHENSPNS